MIYGIVASEDEYRVLEEAAAEGAVVRGLFDFVNGIYKVDQVDYTAAQMITNPEQYITAQGLEIGMNTAWPHAPSIINAALIDIFNNCEFSLVVDFENYAGAAYYAATLLAVEEWWSGVGCIFSAYPAYCDVNENDLRYVWDESTGSPGRHLVAATRTNLKLRITMDNGNLNAGGMDDTYNLMPDPNIDMMDQDENIVPFTEFNNFHIGGTMSDLHNAEGIIGVPVIIKSMMILAPISDNALAQLPALL